MTTVKEQKMEKLETKREMYHLIINGERAESVSGETFTTYNPATGEPVAKVAKGTKEDAERAIQAARQAFDYGKWRHFPVNKRARILNKIASIMRSRFNELVELEILDTGKALSAAQGQVMQAIEDFEFYASAIVGHRGTVNNMPGAFHNFTEKEPVGVCAQIIPWNYPLMMAAWKIAPAIAAGCSVVVKPASLTPLTCIVLAEICHEAGVPEGVVNVVTGSGSEVGNYLVEHPLVDKVAFTGSTPVGKNIMEKASKTLKRVTLELGGKSPNIIFEDADIDAAVNGSLFGIFYNTGQSCEARSRLYVHESIYDQFMEKFVEKTKKLKLGNPFEQDTHVGAIISREQLEVIDSYVKSAIEEGATIVTGGKEAKVEGFENGFWYEPTIITDVNHQMKVVKEEIFGPVVVVMKFNDEKEVIKLANDSEYGLGSAIWTKDHARAIRVAKQIQAGIVMINSPFSAFPGTPFGGYKQSGFGRELCIETLDLYTETKSILSYYGSRPLNPFGV
ncbi:aldehyde dehydrogenase [Parageobacillus toebii NBRC 107807]|jgi:aldehyde dehydrogenase (NAD+)|uniref:Betaine-aldehyde dehydrogenase n=1 Tax=Parageobacillus toebii NBRC 107807 TaxID=1223503 RepID=A0A6G9J6Q9_9BACL|nr:MULTISPECIES: aldehyde dehydrogenase family protein [Bacillaceae]OQO99686.1 aldehyde dehydrogenase [Geobacillus sp. 44C]PDM40976.1 aldehyde dehydrogenase [Parageobacillus yumthangensis]MBB3869592.1 betaine-aldehyde dehydrogenase [Parageobacillus toebii NBRC 107807]QIQ33852.1 aldehyde dehydrogenase [Parageobacillus toebii NBRC 107807]QNU34751.1 aldehyde dehydrogenase [Geobacillus sp. 44C]